MDASALADIRAIEQLYVRYCELVDAKDFDRMDEIFTADAPGDYSQALGEGAVMPDRASLIAAMHKNLGEHSHCGATHHNVGNFRVTLDGDRASAKVHYFAVHQGKGDFAGAIYSMWGEYRDDLVRTGAGWRVANRIYICSITQGPPEIVAG